MYSKLIFNNWKAQPGKIILMFSALCIGLILITLLSTLDSGLKNFFLDESRKEKILRELNVTPKGSKLELNLVNLIPQPRLTAETVDKIKALPEVAEVLPTNTVSGVSSLQFNLLGQIFQTDALLYGAPFELLDSTTVTPKDWSQYDEPYPAVVSSKLIDLYNFSFANANNLPQLTEKNFIGSELTILLNQSTFFAEKTGEVKQLRARIVGFSPNVKIVGITLPLETINRINKKILSQNDTYYLDATVRVKNPTDLTPVKIKLEELGLEVNTAEQSLKSLEKLFSLTELALNIFFVIMITMAGLLISSTFLAKIAEKSKEIAILKTLGLTGNKISQIYLLEAALVGLGASIMGIALAWLLSLPLDMMIENSLKNLVYRPEKFFLFQFSQILTLIIFTIFISCCFAYFPARKAAKLDPVEILSR
jgi:ABC-type antimicrobial peptide transport system permease subunit